MSAYTRPRMTSTELLSYIFEGGPHLLEDSFSRWVTSSTRFRAFAETYRDKIRKKLRATGGEESLRDLGCELEVARLLLQERQFTVEYEKYAAGRTRGPDFTVTFRSNVVFNVEVGRLRPVDGEQDLSGRDSEEGLPTGRRRAVNRLIRVVCGKLRQMRPGIANLLIVVDGTDSINDIALSEAMTHLKERTERKDTTFLSRYGFRDTTDFFACYLRLSSILAYGTGDSGTAKPVVLWENRQARHLMPAAVCTLLQRWKAPGANML